MHPTYSGAATCTPWAGTHRRSNGSCMLGLYCVFICHAQPAIMLVRLLGNATPPVGLRVWRVLVCMAVFAVAGW